MKVDFEDRFLIIGEKRLKLEFPIKELKMIVKKIIVIFDPMYGPKYQQFKNCRAYDLNGKYLWTAEHPTNQSADIYINFMKTKPLILWNFGCYICEIDIYTGKLIKVEFVK